VNLRAATVSDVPAVVALEEELFGVDAWSAESVESEVLGAGRHALVAVDADGTVVGYAVTLAGGDVLDLQRIGVAPGARRRGVGRSLLDAALGAARRSDVPPDRVLLEVSAANDAALAFYAAEGFTEVDRRRRYYRDGTDAVVMRLPLGPACGGRAR
jgi:ribosomal-protein-alanine N-acetyltransferase